MTLEFSLSNLQLVVAPVPMSSKRPQHHLSQFIDEVSASEDESDAFPDHDDKGDNGSLPRLAIDYPQAPSADLIERTDCDLGPTSLQLLLWDDIEDNTSEADRIASIAFEIRNRYKDTPRDPCRIPISVEYPTLDDATIWRVRVKVRGFPLPFSILLTTPKKGSERNVVFAILQQVGLHRVRKAILCAFMRDSIPGLVYVESPTLEDVQCSLSGIPGVLHNRNQFLCVEPISIDDRIRLLEMSAPCVVARGSWVRINRPGPYRNDLGFVLEFDNRQMDMQIAIVPRIPFTSEHTRRPAASLFDKEAVMRCYGPESVSRANRIHIFQGHEFKNGLLEITLGITDILHNNVNPTHSELGLFARCADQDIVAAAYQEMVRTQVQDRIQVVTGGLQGLEGRLTDVDERGIATLDLGAVGLVPQVVSAREIRKEFRLGDSVCVISGDYQGAEGYIVAMEKPFASIYCRLPGQTFSSGGHEVDHSAH